MTDKEYRQQKARVSKEFKKWRAILGLNGDRINFYWRRSIDEDSPRTTMSTNAMWEYRSHGINVYLPEVLELSDDEVTDAVVHELVHILINPATGNSSNKSQAEIEKVEYATQSVTYAIVWAYKVGQREARQ